MREWREHASGTLLCVAAAGVFPFSFHRSKLQNLLPFLFITVIGFIADRFGTAAGILGTLGVDFR